ncbi:hypothetical protein [Paludibaculum fermentans]|uniref:Uncharacterized protein n=1 Tax=Paludibaculum fermentans TaxID=1473598 RepID=A0A7S7NKN7_PALFE|nr:hypothetical protein [Paludibaculum fermentans]QOY85309.1 hypothetical protein IRI77_20990 [Paludibaculum fermentans]
MLFRPISLLLFFALLLPARDLRSMALQLPLGTPLRVQTQTQTIVKARLQSVTDEGISILVLDGGALKEQTYRYSELRYLESRAGRMSGGRAVLTTLGILYGISMVCTLVLLAAH